MAKKGLSFNKAAIKNFVITSASFLSLVTLEKIGIIQLQLMTVSCSEDAYKEFVESGITDPCNDPRSKCHCE